MGRPTAYGRKILDKVSEYIISCEDTRGGTGVHVRLPKIEGLASYLGVNKDTLYEWAKRYPEFSDALKTIKNEQYCRLVDEGLAGRYNPTIAKLLLSANHGLSESSRQITEIRETSDLTPEQKMKLDMILG